MENTQWHMTSEGYWERAMDASEAAAKSLTLLGLDIGRSHKAESSAIQLSFPIVGGRDLISAARQAWIDLRYEQPNIATILDRDQGVWTYNIGTKSEIKNWLKETFRVEDKLKSRELFPKLWPVRRPTLYILPNSEELLLRVPHTTVDGMGILGFWHDFLAVLAEPRIATFGDEGRNLSPVLQDAANIPEHNEKHTARAAKELNDFVTNMPSIGVPFTPTSLPTETTIYFTYFTVAQTKELIRVSKAKSLKLVCCIHAALILAARKLCTNGASKYVSFAPFDLRPRCTPETQRFNMALYSTAWTLVVEDMDFINTAKYLEEYYRDRGSDKELLSTIEPWARLLMPLVETPALKPELGPSEPMLSSLGVADNKIRKSYRGGIEVKDVWIGIDNLTPQVAVLLFSFREQMRFSSFYNVAFRTEKEVADFHALVVDILVESLGIKNFGQQRSVL